MKVLHAAASLLIAAVLATFSGAAMAQSTPLQGGPWVPSHVVQYVNPSNSVPVIVDGGGAGGGGFGANPSELGITAQGSGLPPFNGQGTGPNGENICDYDGPTTSAAGYHVLCLSALANGGGLISYNAFGGAASLPLNIDVNGVLTPFTGGATGPAGGDLSGTYPNPTVAKVHGVTYPASPSTNTVPVVTGSNTVTYEAVPNAALANSSMTLAGHSVALGGTQTFACADLSNGATGCSTATGTSGATIPLLNGVNTWSAVQTFPSPALTGTVTGNNTIPLAILAQGAANTMLGNWTGSTADVAANAMPACADSGGNHLNYVSGTGVTCGTSDSHGGTVTSIATTGPITGGSITTTGTIACATCVTSSGGGAATGTAPVAVSAAGVVSITGAVGQVLAGASPAFTATPTLGVAGATLGTLTFAGSTSGTTVLQPNVAATGTVTLPAATDTLIGKATTDTLTNKTYDTAGTGNSFSINGLAATSNTGTGSVARAAGPTFTGTANFDTVTAATGLNLATSSGVAAVLIDAHTAGNNAAVKFESIETPKWEMGKDGLDNFFYYDDVGTRTVMTIAAGAGGSMALNPTNGSVTTGGAFKPGGHIGQTGTPPAITACGTTPSAATGTDTAGQVTEGTTATGCTITFNVAFSSAPFCVVGSQTQLVAFAYVLSTTAITVTNTSTSGDKINWICMGV